MGNQDSLREAAQPSSQLVKRFNVLPLNQLADLFLHRVPISNQLFTYAFIPQNFLRSLYGVYGLDLPTQFTKPDLSLLGTNDAFPSNIDPSSISYVGEFFSAPTSLRVSNPCTTAGLAHHGEPVAFNSVVANTTNNQGWTTAETAFIRLNTTFTPFGRFPVYSNRSLPYYNGTQNLIGYDVAVCVQLYEPWIIEAYNTSTGSPTALRIVDKGDGSTSPLPSGIIQGTPIAGARYLNTTGKDAVLSMAHLFSFFRMAQVAIDQGKGWGTYGPAHIVGPPRAPPVRHFF